MSINQSAGGGSRTCPECGLTVHYSFTDDEGRCKSCQEGGEE